MGNRRRRLVTNAASLRQRQKSARILSASPIRGKHRRLRPLGEAANLVVIVVAVVVESSEIVTVLYR